MASPARISPTRSKWLATASRLAQEAGVDPALVVMVGRAGRPATTVRWAAWHEILQSNPNYSVNGLSIVSGFDHTAIIYAMRKMAVGEKPWGRRLASPKPIRKIPAAIAEYV